jgi:hypothetical protein
MEDSIIAEHPHGPVFQMLTIVKAQNHSSWPRKEMIALADTSPTQERNYNLMKKLLTLGITTPPVSVAKTWRSGLVGESGEM